MARNSRQSKILELISTKEIETQDIYELNEEIKVVELQEELGFIPMKEKNEDEE